MRCRTCGEKAAINMRHHKLSLCAEHYLEWLLAQVERFIRKQSLFTKEDRVLVAVSGGKDSLAMWDMLERLGYKTEGLYIDLGIDESINYSAGSRECAQIFADQRGLKLTIVSLPGNYHESLPEMAIRTKRGRENPCSLCGLVKRHLFNSAALDGDFDVLATAHNLDDEAAILLANTLEWSLEHLSRGQPLLPPAPGFARKVKPFARVYEFESAAYAYLRGIQWMPDECPFSRNSKQIYYKSYLNEWEDEMPGVKLRFYNNYLKALDGGAFPERQEQAQQLDERRCPNCGQPTTTGGLCAFCRLFVSDFPG
jgi:uncharacterized protein (TIGR00269 family)